MTSGTSPCPSPGSCFVSLDLFVLHWTIECARKRKKKKKKPVSFPSLSVDFAQTPLAILRSLPIYRFSSLGYEKWRRAVVQRLQLRSCRNFSDPNTDASLFSRKLKSTMPIVAQIKVDDPWSFVNSACSFFLRFCKAKDTTMRFLSLVPLRCHHESRSRSRRKLRNHKRFSFYPESGLHALKSDA